MNQNNWSPFFRLLLTISVGAIVGELAWRGIFDMLRVQPEITFLGPLTIIPVTLYWLVYGPLTTGLTMLFRRRLPLPIAGSLAAIMIYWIVAEGLFLLISRRYASQQEWSRWLVAQQFNFAEAVIIAVCVALAVLLRPEPTRAEHPT